jgi:carbon monoxide dehydrogenase subunit G
MTDTFRVERSTIVEAPAKAIFPLINDFHRWAEWSPFEKMDANMEKTFSGAASGQGAAYAWVGKKSGSGRMEILTSEAPSKVIIKLDFSKPFEAHNTAEFTIEPQAVGTKVTWAMTGPHTLMSRMMHLVYPMDKMVGPQFAEGLASLKRIAEGASVAA